MDEKNVKCVHSLIKINNLTLQGGQGYMSQLACGACQRSDASNICGTTGLYVVSKYINTILGSIVNSVGKVSCDHSKSILTLVLKHNENCCNC